MYTYGFLMLTESSVDDAAVEADLGGVGDIGEDAQGAFKILVIVVVQGLDPSLDFLDRMVSACA